MKKITDRRSYHHYPMPLPISHQPSSALAAARMFAPTKTIAPYFIISLISEEFERQKTQKSRRLGKTKEDDKDEAMAVGSSSKGKGKKLLPRGVCWNCGEKGHYKDKCTKPAKVIKDQKKEADQKKSD